MKNYCGQYRRHAWVVANVSQVIQFGADEVYVCYRCRKPRNPTLIDKIVDGVGGLACVGHEDFKAGTRTFHREGECPS